MNTKLARIKIAELLYPNDMELGKEVRKIIKALKKEELKQKKEKK